MEKEKFGKNKQLVSFSSKTSLHVKVYFWKRYFFFTFASSFIFKKDFQNKNKNKQNFLLHHGCIPFQSSSFVFFLSLLFISNEYMILVACAGNFGGLLEADLRTNLFEGRDLMKNDLHFQATILPNKSKISNT